MADRQREDARLSHELELTELLFGLLDDGVISYEDMRQIDPPDHKEKLVQRFRQRFTDDELQSLPRAFALKAKPEELLRLGVSGLTCEGEDLAAVSSERLRDRMKGVQELRARTTPSAWLAHYAALLVHESRRRKGIA